MSTPTHDEPEPPSVSDRVITTFAILKVNHDNDQTTLGNYLPFVYHCLWEMDVEAVSTPDLRQRLAETFGIDLPQGVLKQILKRACDEGQLSKANDVYEVERRRLQDFNLNPTRETVLRGYHELVDRLVAFAQEHFAVSWTQEQAGLLISSYVDRYSSGVLATALAGTPPPPPPHTESELTDEYVIHRFVAYAYERSTQQFTFLETVVKGRMLADALYFETEGKPKPKSLAGLEVYFDGPILLHMLGYGGPGLQAPYTELLEILRQQDVHLRCFSHSANEAQEILEVAAKQTLTGKPERRYNGDVVTYLMHSGKSRSDIELASRRLNRDLLKIGIQTVDTPDEGRAPQLNVERLATKLGQELQYNLSTSALHRDVDSLAGVYRLRDGRNYRDISETQAVFVTANYDLFRSSFDFFKLASHVRTVPVCVYHTSFTVVVWLRASQAKPNLPRERLIADTYAALNPPDSLWHIYNKEIERLKESKEITEDDVHYLRFADEAVESLMDITRGDASVFTEGTLAEVLGRSRDAIQASLKEELDIAQEDKRRIAEGIARSHRRLDKISRAVASIVAAVVCLCFSAILVTGAYTSVEDVIDRHFHASDFQIASFVTLALVGLWSLVRTESLAKAPVALARSIEIVTTDLLHRIMQPPPLPAPQVASESPETLHTSRRPPRVDISPR